MSDDDKSGGGGSGRRRFMIRSAGTLSSLLLGGCDSLSHDKTFQKIINSAEDLNKRLQPALVPRNALAREYTEADISPHFRSNGTHYPGNPVYKKLAADNFANWKLRVDGLVKHPTDLSLNQIHVLPSRTQITRHDCVEGWSCIGKWKGARLSALLERVKPASEARYVMFYCYDALQGADHYYESINLEDAFHPQTILAYRFDDKPLPIPYGAPLRLRVERQLGYKMAKYLKRIELVKSFDHIRGGNGGFWEDRGYEWYAGI